MNSLASHQDIDEPTPTTVRMPRVLVAEDDDDVRHALRLLFDFEGYEVWEACDGAELMRVLTTSILSHEPTSVPDLIITDVRMPGFNGLDLIQMLRRAGWEGPVIVMSAFTCAEIEDRVAQMGDALFLNKPLDADQLMEEVRKRVRNRFIWHRN